MVSCHSFFEALKSSGFEFFAGVPDSLLKNFCFYVSDNLPPSKHIITANEGSAVALASGYHFATGKIPVVYFQNSGLGNTINPVLSLADNEVYSVPMLLLVGWRGEPGVKDEPQHLKQGKVMLSMLESMQVPFEVLGPDSDIDAVLEKAKTYMKEKNAPFVVAVREGTFGAYELKTQEPNNYPLTRELAIESILDCVGAGDVVVCTTGKASRELYELRVKRGESNRADFLTVGSMGHASQIALGIALERPNKNVFCIDGDGSVLMHTGGLATIAKCKAKNFFHVMINNGAHESVGGQATGAFEINWQNIVQAFGYAHAFKAETVADLKSAVATMPTLGGPVFLEVRTSQGSRKDLGRPKSSPVENKRQLMEALDT
jgi:phosphonopyruvate decarboxylase